MKVVAFSGSARKGGNTARMLERVLGVLAAEGIETELVELAGKKAQGCTVCLKCRERADRRCHGRNDAINECITKAGEADGIIIGSPVYFADITPETKALIDRLGYVAGANPGMLDRKVGAAVVVERRAGAVRAFDSIMHLFMIRQMIVAGSRYWNLGLGAAPGEVEADEEGMATMDVLGTNMAWLLKQTAHAR
ncbi:MAG: flavodoxin family protein [Coriobacteriia bacterium]|nr:flavodoxin family protein [Coriobacteriia bacterium]MBN2847941.1 flavodoxin family protein [Coriobacteriia bacterium]